MRFARGAWLAHHAKQQQLLRPYIDTPPVRASDLQARGIAPGPRMGKLLREAQRIAINEQISDRNVILQRLGLDSNFLLDLARDLDFAHNFRLTFQ